MATSSRLPQRKKVLAAQPELGNDARSSAQEVHAALVAIGYTSSTVQDLERILQGPLGDGIQFIASHLLGRTKVAHVRSELQRLKEIPTSQTRGVSSSSTAVDQHAKALSKLSRTRKEVAARQRELDGLQSAAVHGNASESVEEALGTSRTNAFLLQVLLAKEECRVSRVEHLNQILNEMRERTGRTDVPPDCGPPLTEALAQIRDQLSDIQEWKLRRKEPVSPGTVIGATSSAGDLGRLYTHVRDASSKITSLADEACSNPKPARDDLLDVLTLLRIRHNTLSRTLSSTPSAPIATLSGRLDASLAKSLGWSPSDPEVADLRERIIASSEARARKRLQEDTQAMFPKAPSPSSTDLNEALSLMTSERQRAQTLLSLYHHLLVSTSRTSETLQERARGPLCDLRAECREKEKTLMRYPDVQRHHITQGPVAAHSTGSDTDIHAALGLPLGMAPLETLNNIGEMILQTTTLRQALSRKPKIDVPSIDSGLLNDFLKGQHEAEKNALRLLKRKNEKMQMSHVLEADIKRFVDEGDGIIGGKLGERSAKGGHP